MLAAGGDHFIIAWISHGMRLLAVDLIILFYSSRSRLLH
jgi:type IV secretory pathway TrbL component